MQVEDRLTAIDAVVDDEAEALVQALLLGHELCGVQQMPEQRFVALFGSRELREPVAGLGNDQNVHWRLRVRVVERQALVVFVRNAGGHLPPDDPVEDRLVGRRTRGSGVQSRSSSSSSSCVGLKPFVRAHESTTGQADGRVTRSQGAGDGRAAAPEGFGHEWGREGAGTWGYVVWCGVVWLETTDGRTDGVVPKRLFISYQVVIDEGQTFGGMDHATNAWLRS